MPLENVRIVLVSPIYGGNVGSVCRAMANMGLADLRIAAPTRLNMDEARQMSVSAAPILEGRREFPDLASAVADCTVVAGATARPGLYRSHARTPRELAPRLLEAAAAGRIALVFGPEVNGLTNEDLALCTHILRIPSAPAYKSLNLAQAAIICCYELYVASGQFERPAEPSEEAPSALRERMFALWEKMLLAIGFMKEDKALHMMLGLRRILARGALTHNDVKIMMGIARQSLWASARAGTAGVRHGKGARAGRRRVAGGTPARRRGAGGGGSRRARASVSRIPAPDAGAV